MTSSKLIITILANLAERFRVYFDKDHSYYSRGEGSIYKECNDYIKTCRFLQVVCTTSLRHAQLHMFQLL